MIRLTRVGLRTTMNIFRKGGVASIGHAWIKVIAYERQLMDADVTMGGNLSEEVEHREGE